MRDPSAPPGWAEAILARLLPERYREEHLGDLREGWQRLAHEPAAARRWYFRQFFKSLVHGLRMRVRPARPHRHHTGNTMDSLLQDLRYGLRSLRNSPGFAVTATLTLALAIGVNTAIFSMVSGIVFADLPMQEPETATIVRGVNPELGVAQGSVSVPDFIDLRERATSFESLAALTEDQWVMTGVDAPERVRGFRATTNLLDNWQLPPVLGRGFAEGEDGPGANPVAMLSYPFWQTRFAGDPEVIGRTIRLDGTPHTVVGVTDPRVGFASLAKAQVWVPLALERNGAGRDARWLFVTGRLEPGVTQEQATDEVAAIGEALAREHPGTNAGWDLWSAPVMESLLSDGGATIMTLLTLTVGFVVLIACANIANMMLARASARTREISVRAALGAGRLRLLRQMLTESFMISISAAALGLLLAGALIEALIFISNGTEEVFLMAAIDGRVLVFTLVVSLLAPLAFGLLPALRVSGTGAAAALRDGRGSDGGRGSKRARGLLAGAQVALALTLMIVAGLLSRTVYELTARAPGFEVEDLVAVDLDLPDDGYPDDEARRQFYRQAVEAVRGVPAVSGVALTNVLPGADFGARRSLEIEGRPIVEGRASPSVEVVSVSPELFEVLGVPVLAGRPFGDQDGPDAAGAVILSKGIADRHWPDESPLGARVRLGSDATGAWLSVVGVVGDVVATNTELPSAPNVYLPHAQSPRAASYIVARSSAPLDSLAGPLREAVWEVDPNQPVDRVITVLQAQYDSEASTYAVITLFVSFAAFALLMATVGVYGVVSYSVSQRRAEIGLRMALGAQIRDVRRMVVGQGTGVVLGGMVVGLLGALALSRTLASVVVGVSATDPTTFVAVSLVLFGAALLAHWIPARRATRTDPVTALRTE